MKLTDETAPQQARRDPSLLVRAALAIALAALLLVALNWALNVTNANARQVSTGLTHLQNGMEQRPGDSESSRPQTNSGTTNKESGSRNGSGPTLEPVDSGQ